MSEHTVKSIARIKCDLPSKFGLPRQAGIVSELEGLIIFEEEYRNDEALRGLEEFSHIWLIWQFSENLREGFSPTVRPPRLGGNRRMGVFATRSPFRPNALGLSCVRLLGLKKLPGCGTVLRISGADLMDGTPIFDIKPYIPYADAHPEASSGFAPDPGARLQVEIMPGVEGSMPPDKLKTLTELLANDPRPRYQKDKDRVYTMDFAGYAASFSVDGNKALLLSVIRTDK